MGAAGTSSLCVNGTGVTLASTNTGFSIPSDDVSFTGASAGNSSSTAPSASATAKSGAGFIQVSAVLYVAVACAALILL